MSSLKITNDILLAVPQRFPDSRVWRNNRLVARDAKRTISAGVDGQADISGILAPKGKRLEIEVKAGKDRSSDAQRDFGAMITRAGGVYVIVCTDHRTVAKEADLALIEGGYGVVLGVESLLLWLDAFV